MRKRRDVKKKPIDPERIRQIPNDGFSWIDRRFVREGFIEPLAPEAILLYFFLVSVSDAHGLSFYADPTVSRILKLDPEEFSKARARLLSAKLILYQYPLYQVLPLPPRVYQSESAVSSESMAPRGGDPVPLNELLTVAMSKARKTQRFDEKS